MEICVEQAPLEQASLPAPAVSHRRLLLYALLAALAVRLVVVALVYPGFLAPGREHWLFGFEIGKIAQSIVQGHGFGNLYYGGRTGPTAEIAPVLPYIMAGVFALFGIYTRAAAIVMLGLNSLFSALTCVPIFFVAKRSFGFRIARWATWTWAFFPYAIYFSADSMWDRALVTLLLTSIFWTALSLRGSSRIAAWAGFGFLCGFCALANPVVLGVAPILGAWVCYRLYRTRRAWLLRAATAAAVMCATVAPWLARNYWTFHEPVFLKDDLPFTELCVGNLGNSLHWWNGSMHPCGSRTQLANYQQLGEQAYMAAEWERFRNFVGTNPRTFVLRSVRRFVYVWTGYWSFNRQYLREEPFDLGDIPFRTALTVLAIVGLLKMIRRNPNEATPYALMLIFFPMVFYITHPEIAYRHPIDPEIVILACFAVASIARHGEKEAPLKTDYVEQSIETEYVFR